MRSPDQIAAAARRAKLGPKHQGAYSVSAGAGAAGPQPAWTTSLGNAYYNQPQDVLQTIQVMRERAEQAGNLQSTPQAEVSNNQGNIDIAPPNPQVVYVPAITRGMCMGSRSRHIRAFRCWERLNRFSAPVWSNMA